MEDAADCLGAVSHPAESTSVAHGSGPDPEIGAGKRRRQTNGFGYSEKRLIV
jgi:hypothetical protein